MGAAHMLPANVCSQERPLDVITPFRALSTVSLPLRVACLSESSDDGSTLWLGGALVRSADEPVEPLGEPPVPTATHDARLATR